MDHEFIAVDIGKRHIKLVKIFRKNNTAQLESIGSIEFPKGLNSTLPTKDEADKLQLLASTIKSLVETTGVKTKQVVTALPESTVFTKLLPSLPLVDPAKLEEMIYWEAKQVLPIPLDDAQIDWIEIGQNESQTGVKTVSVMVIAAPKVLVETYLNLFELAELELIALEVQSVALARVVQFTYPNDTTSSMIMDVGADGTDVSIVQGGRLIFTQSISTGSDAFSKAIASDFGLQVSQADQYKISYGLLPNQNDGGKIFNSIKPLADVIINEVRKIIGFIQTRMNYGVPQKVVLTGNGSLLPGLPQYIQSSLNMNVVLLDPFTNVQLKGNLSNIRNQIAPQGYGLAVGLGLKDQ